MPIYLQGQVVLNLSLLLELIYRSFSLVSDNPGPSFATVSGAVRSSGPFDVPSALAAAHRGLPVQGMKFFWEGGFWRQIFGPSDPLGEYVWFSLQETRGTAA